jgi:hypothetical protein
MVNRIRRDDPSKSDMHNRQGITLDLMWKAMKDYDMQVPSEVRRRLHILTSTQVANMLARLDIWNRKINPYKDQKSKIVTSADILQPARPPDQYLTLMLRRLGFDTFDSNLLSIPAQALTTINVRSQDPSHPPHAS